MATSGRITAGRSRDVLLSNGHVLPVLPPSRARNSAGVIEAPAASSRWRCAGTADWGSDHSTSPRSNTGLSAEAEPRRRVPEGDRAPSRQA